VRGSGRSLAGGLGRFASPQRAATGALLLVPGALTLYFGFRSGGYFAGPTGLAAALVALILAVRVTLSRQPFAGLSIATLLAATALAVYTVVTLVSANWSGAPSRALLEYDRALLYLLALVVFGSLPVTRERLEWALRAFAVGLAIVCLAGLVSRLAPDLISVPMTKANDRLSYPVSYWNALGLLAAIGIIMSLHLASGPAQPRLVRALGAAAIPPLAATLLLTFSRGAIVVLALAIVLYVVLARPWGLLATAAIAGPATAVALAETYAADLLATFDPTTPAAVAQGHRLAAVLAACTLAAGLVRGLAGGIDAHLERRAERRRAELGARRAPALVGAALAALAVTALALALGLPGLIEQQYERFEADSYVETSDVRDRLTSTADNGRVVNWSVALEGFAAAPLIGQGAGTYQLLWDRRRAVSSNVVDGHSLYLEVMSELGLVGLALLGVTLLALIVAIAVRARGADRSLYAALLAAMIAWAIHAGIDWDWELPVVTFWVFALGGLAIAAPRREPGERTLAPLTRIIAALGCLVLAVTPALAALSQERLAASISAFKRGDCRAAAGAALDSIAFLDVRPQPYELLAYCDVRAGIPGLGTQVMGRALALDPDNWEYHYGLALTRAASGQDPRKQAAMAVRLNPRSPLAQDAGRRLATDEPAEWRRRALEARLPIQP